MTQQQLHNTYGHWTVLNPQGPYRAHDPIHCICTCGTERAIPKHKLTTGKSLSCGCRRHDRLTGKHWPTLETATTLDIGDRHGRWTITGQPIPGGKHRTIPCQCDCGTVRNVVISSLIAGKSKSCGCWRADGARALHTP